MKNECDERQNDNSQGDKNSKEICRENWTYGIQFSTLIQGCYLYALPSYMVVNTVFTVFIVCTLPHTINFSKINMADENPKSTSHYTKQIQTHL
jgi:hypothetical protein